MNLSSAVKSKINRYFPPKFVAGTDEELTDRLVQFYCEYINSLVENALAGSYLDKDFLPEVFKSVNELKNLLNNLTSPNSTVGILMAFDDLIFNNLRDYFKFSKNIKISDDKKRILPVKELGESAIDRFIEISDKFFQITTIHEFDKLFQITLKVSYYDHKLSADPQILAELFTWKQDIGELKTVFSLERKKHKFLSNTIFFIDLLSDKIDYLMSLINRRNRVDGDFYILFDGFKDNIQPPAPDFKFPQVKSVFHRSGIVDPLEEVNVNDWKHSSSDDEKKFLAGEKLELNELHALARIVSKKSFISINHSDILKYVDGIDRNSLSEYNQVVVNQFHLYLLNNQLSFFIKNSEAESTISALFDEIRKLNRKYGIHNYFPHLKLCRKYLSEFNQAFAQPQKDKNWIAQLQEILVKFKESLTDLDGTFIWANKNAFCPFRETIDKCTITIGYRNRDYKLLIASAYSTPLNYKSIYTTITGLKSLPEILEQQIQNGINLINFHTKIEGTISKVNELKTGLESSQKKQVEILSIFAAIVLFVSGNIQLFKEVENVAQGLHFMLIFSLSLSLFVSLIWVVFNDPNQKIRKKQWMMLGFYFLVFIVAIFTLPLDSIKSFPKVIFIHLFPF